MHFEEFTLERNQSLFENMVKYNLSESGVHPLKISEVLSEKEMEEVLDMELFYGFTNGSPKLRQRISQIYDRNLSSENVLVTCGSAEANFLSVMTLLESEDEIIYMIPNYLQIFHLANSLGIKVKCLPLRHDLGWQWDLIELKKIISKKTKMIVLCNPNNPTGSVMNNEVMGEIIAIAGETGCWLLCDEVYRGSELNGVECNSFVGSTPKTVVNSGLSKAYSLPGLRVGWSVASPEFIDRAWSFHDYTVINVSFISDWIAAKILTEKRRKKILQRTKDHLNNNVDRLCLWAEEAPQIKVDRPKASAITFAKINIPISSEELVIKLREKCSVLVTAGKWHGMEGYVRIGYGSSTDYMMRGLGRIKNFLNTNNFK